MKEAKELKKLYKQMTPEYQSFITEVIEHPEFQKRKTYHHHENRSVYTHSLMVSIKSYKVAKLLHLDYKSAAIGGLLHDFYYEDWQLNLDKKKPLLKSHGFIHPKEALENSKVYFPKMMNKKIENIIVRHMFPLTIVPPFYLESWVITIVDKYVSCEIFKTPQELYKYIGLTKKKRSDKNE